MDFDGDVIGVEEEINAARGFYERLRGMFGNGGQLMRIPDVTGTPIFNPRTVNMFRPLIIHDDEEEDDDNDDNDEDEDDDHVPDLVDVSMTNRVRSPFSPDQDDPRRIVLARNPTMERPTTFDVPYADHRPLAVNIRAPMAESTNNPQMSDITRRMAQSNSNPEQLFRLIFETMVEEDDLDEMVTTD